MLARIAARLSRSSLSPASRLGQRTHVPSRTALTLASCNEKVRAASYAVRGELVLRADKYQRQLAQSGGQGHGLPFDSIIYCNIGNPHAVGSLPMTYFRQVMALVDCPPLLRQVEQAQADAPASDVAVLFPRDVVARARQYSDAIPGGTGAYTNSQGLDIVRQEVAAYITERDGTNGIPAASADDVFLTDGASPGVKMLAQLMLRDQSDGLMIPIPQYPLYSATVAVCGGTQLGYYLDEATNWSLDLNELQRTHDDALSRGVSPRGLTIINPGNPTGQCLPEDNIRDVIRFCEANELLIMADEVYQTNIYAQTPFTSFRKALLELGGETAKKVQLVSFHSTSKGFVGECGRRGGYFELINIDEDVKMELYKLASINLCSNVNGQVMTGLMTRPPQQGEESFELYEQERVGALEGLSRRAGVLVEGLNKLEGVSCQIVEGAMYAFPTVTLPEGAIEAAKQQGKAADVFYCLELLDATGVCVVPGSGFGQRDNTFHFRTTILPLQIEEVVERVSRFHTEFMAKYA